MSNTELFFSLGGLIITIAIVLGIGIRDMLKALQVQNETFARVMFNHIDITKQDFMEIKTHIDKSERRIDELMLIQHTKNT